MKVTIDGIDYVQAPKVSSDKTLLAALDVRFDSDVGDNITVRDYLFKQLETLWSQGEGFSGKRPFGNSGWEYDLYTPLVSSGFIAGTLDEYGSIELFNRVNARAYVLKLVAAAFYGVKDAQSTSVGSQ